MVMTKKQEESLKSNWIYTLFWPNDLIIISLQKKGMIYIIHPDNPDQRKIKLAVEVLNKGGIIIYPTDSVYNIGCSLQKKRAIEKLAQIKGIKLKKANFSILCSDLSHLSDYTKPIDRATYKLLNKN